MFWITKQQRQHIFFLSLTLILNIMLGYKITYKNNISSLSISVAGTGKRKSEKHVLIYSLIGRTAQIGDPLLCLERKGKKEKKGCLRLFVNLCALSWIAVGSSLQWQQQEESSGGHAWVHSCREDTHTATHARKYTHKHMQLRTQDTQGCVHVTCICTRMSHTHTYILWPTRSWSPLCCNPRWR